MSKAKKKTVEVALHRPGNLKGEMKVIGGSMSDCWNQVITSQVVNVLWQGNSTPAVANDDRVGVLEAMACIKPRDELEGMLAAQLIACHNASMECYRRALHRQSKAA